MQKSLKKQTDAEQPEVQDLPEADTQALAELEDYDIVEASAVSLALGSVEGSIDSRDLIIPRLNIVQSVGPLSADNRFKGGDLVFNKETVLAQVGEAISITVLSIKKTYEERLPYDPNGPRPKVFNTIEEVVDAGMWVDWRDNQPPPVREVADVLVLIEKPDGVEDLGFSREYTGVPCALAMWTLRGTAYTRGAKKIFSANSIELAKTGLLSGSWDLETERVQINGNWVFAPVLRLAGRNKPEFIKEVTADLS